MAALGYVNCRLHALGLIIISELVGRGESSPQHMLMQTVYISSVLRSKHALLAASSLISTDEHPSPIRLYLLPFACATITVLLST